MVPKGCLPLTMTQSDPMKPQLRWRSTRAEESDQKFADGQDMTGDLDFTSMRRPGLEQRRINVDFRSG